MVSSDPPQSSFKRPFGTPAPAEAPAPAEHAASPRATLLAAEWETLEARISAVLSGGAPGANQRQDLQSQVSSFLRLWGVRLAQAPPLQQNSLRDLLESARASLLAQLSLLGESAQLANQRAAEARAQAALDQAEHQRRLAAGQAEVRRLQAETARIQAETARASQLSSDRNHQLARAALFPESYCPHCSRPYQHSHLEPYGHANPCCGCQTHRF